MPDTSTSNLLTIDQLADRLSITPRHVRRLIAERRIPFVKVGHLVRFDPADIATWINERRTQATSGPPMMRASRRRASQ